MKCITWVGLLALACGSDFAASAGDAGRTSDDGSMVDSSAPPGAGGVRARVRAAGGDSGGASGGAQSSSSSGGADGAPLPRALGGRMGAAGGGTGPGRQFYLHRT